MVIILKILFWLCFFQILAIIFISSNIILNIENCDIIYTSDNQKTYIRNAKINVQLYVFNKIKLLDIRIHENFCELFKIKFRVNLFEKIKIRKESDIKFVFKNLDELKPKIEKLKFRLKLGTEDIIITTILIPILSTTVSLYASRYTDKNYSKENVFFKILPIYQFNQNILEFKGDLRVCFNTIRVLNFILKQRNIRKEMYT